MTTAEPAGAELNVGRWRYVFLAKGWYNIVLSPLFAAGPLVSEWFREWSQTTDDSALMYLHIFLAHAFFFGCVYVWMARDPLRHIAIVYLSIPIEIAFVTIVLANWAAGNIDFVLTLPALQDGLLAILLTVFLVRYRAAPSR